MWAESAECRGEICPRFVELSEPADKAGKKEDLLSRQIMACTNVEELCQVTCTWNHASASLLLCVSTSLRLMYSYWILHSHACDSRFELSS